MKFIVFFTIILSLSTFSSHALDVEDLKNSLQGEFAGHNCGLTIDTQWYGNGYYKRFTFLKNGQVFDVETFHTAKIARNVSGLEFYLKDEVGSDGGDKHIELSMTFEVIEDQIDVLEINYKHFSYNLFGIPTGLGKLGCRHMQRVGPGSQLQF